MISFWNAVWPNLAASLIWSLPTVAFLLWRHRRLVKRFELARRVISRYVFEVDKRVDRHHDIINNGILGDPHNRCGIDKNGMISCGLPLGHTGKHISPPIS